MPTGPTQKSSSGNGCINDIVCHDENRLFGGQILFKPTAYILLNWCLILLASSTKIPLLINVTFLQGHAMGQNTS